MNETTKIRTLIAEDEESFLRVLTTILESTNRFLVYPCESGDEAVEALKRSRYDVVILDHKMPGMTGLNVLQWLHEQKSTTPVIMLTGAGSENIAVEAMKLGAYDYIRKDQFDRDHFPIIVYGVYERYLFKKEKEQRENASKEQERNLASLELLSNSVLSFAQIADTTFTMIALLTDEGERTLRPWLPPDGKEDLANCFQKIREHYEFLVAMSKSIVVLSDQLSHSEARKQSTRPAVKELSPDSKPPQEKTPDDR